MRRIFGTNIARGVAHPWLSRPALRQVGEYRPTRKERIRGLDTHFHFVLSWAARSDDAVFGKLVNEIVGIADVINDLYAGPGTHASKIGL